LLKYDHGVEEGETNYQGEVQSLVEQTFGRSLGGIEKVVDRIPEIGIVCRPHEE